MGYLKPAMKKLLKINPGFYAVTLFVALLVAGILLGGFLSIRVNGSTICLNCIGIFRMGRVGTIIGYVAIGAAALLFVLLLAGIAAHKPVEKEKSSAMRSRRITQFAALIVANPWFYYYKDRMLVNKSTKGLCFPGMNCYACPQAMFSCPIGALQHSFASRSASAMLYVIGTIGAIGAVVGRMPCGWVCPFGLLQDLLYKIPVPKLKLPKYANYFKYVSLGVLAILLPFILRDHWFSKLCPVGVMEGGIPLQILPPSGVSSDALQPGVFFWLKIAILAVFLLWMTTTKRPFCRAVCPMGAALSLFNPISLYRLEVDTESCKKCGKCRKVCPVDINVFDNPNSLECIRCLECKKACPTGAVTSGFRPLRWRNAPATAEKVKGAYCGTGDGNNCLS